MRVWSLIFVGLALSCALARAGRQGWAGGGLRTRNRQTSTDIVRFLVEYLTKDVANNREGIAKSSEQIAKLANMIIAYVDKTNSEATDKVEATLKAMQVANERNMKIMMDQLVQNDNSLQTHTYANNEKLSSALIKTTNNALGEIESRMKQHEDLLSTHVALCAFAPSHLTTGPVQFDRIFLDSITIKGKPKTGSNTLRQGHFYVPKGGDGTYQITFGLILDTVSDNSLQAAPVSFALKSQIDKRVSMHLDSVVTSTAGYNGGYNDLVPASRTIHLNMKFGDSIWLEQFYRTAENTYQLNMCVHLVHPRPPGYSNWRAIKPAVAPTLEPNDIFEAPTLEEFTVNNQSIAVAKPEVNIPAPKVMTWPDSTFISDWDPKPSVQKECNGLDPNCNANRASNPSIASSSGFAMHPLYGQDLYGHDGFHGGPGSMVPGGGGPASVPEPVPEPEGSGM